MQWLTYLKILNLRTSFKEALKETRHDLTNIGDNSELIATTTQAIVYDCYQAYKDYKKR